MRKLALMMVALFAISIFAAGVAPAADAPPWQIQGANVGTVTDGEILEIAGSETSPALASEILKIDIRCPANKQEAAQYSIEDAAGKVVAKGFLHDEATKEMPTTALYFRGNWAEVGKYYLRGHNFKKPLSEVIAQPQVPFEPAPAIVTPTVPVTDPVYVQPIRPVHAETPRVVHVPQPVQPRVIHDRDVVVHDRDVVVHHDRGHRDVVVHHDDHDVTKVVHHNRNGHSGHGHGGHGGHGHGGHAGCTGPDCEVCAAAGAGESCGCGKATCPGPAECPECQAMGLTAPGPGPGPAPAGPGPAPGPGPGCECKCCPERIGSCKCGPECECRGGDQGPCPCEGGPIARARNEERPEGPACESGCDENGVRGTGGDCNGGPGSGGDGGYGGEGGEGGEGGGGEGGGSESGEKADMPIQVPYILYIATDSGDGTGKIFQVDENGRILGKILLPHPPSSLALHRQRGLVASLPAAGSKIVRVDETGKLQTVVEKSKKFSHATDVALGAEMDSILIADNTTDKLLSTNTSGREPKVYNQIEGQQYDKQTMSIAITPGGRVILGTSGSRGNQGVYFLDGDGSGMDEPILPEAGGVAADIKTQKWAATQSPNKVHVFEGDQPIHTINLPAGDYLYKQGLLSYGLVEDLAVVTRDAKGENVGPTILVYGKDCKVPRRLFRWDEKGEEFMDFVIGPRMLWNRNERPKYKVGY